MNPKLQREPINLFGVDDLDHEEINLWVADQKVLEPSMRMRAGEYPAIFSKNWRTAGQTAFARIWSEQPIVLGLGGFCIALLPILFVASYLTR